jgi:hypothetical protein
MPVYRREGNDTLIEITLREVRQLFHTLDPAPFYEKDIDDNAEQYLLEACREARSHRQLRLVVHLPEKEMRSEAARTLPSAVNNYFAYRQREQRLDILRLLHQGMISLVIGLLFLVACLALRRTLIASSAIADRTIINEGLLILGWVAMWRPMEMLLYDWWPMVRQRALLRRLAVMPVELRSSG